MSSKDKFAELDFNADGYLPAPQDALYSPNGKLIPRPLDDTTARLNRIGYVAALWSHNLHLPVDKFAGNKAGLTAEQHRQAVQEYLDKGGVVTSHPVGATWADPYLKLTHARYPKSKIPHELFNARFAKPCLAARGTLPVAGPRG